MRRLKRFRNLLRYVYSAGRAFGQQFRTRDWSRVEERAGEHESLAATALANSQLKLGTQPSVDRKEVINSPIASAPPQAVPPQVETTLPVERVAVTPPEKTVKPVSITEKGCATPVAEPKRIVAPPQKVTVTQQKVPQQKVGQQKVPQGPEKVPQPAVATQPSAVVPVKTQNGQTSLAKDKPNGSNGGASKPPSVGGKYDPKTINDQTAQRLARLLVSEIKLYYQSKTEGEGGSEVKNIYDRLKDPIDKSRQHYKQRMGETAINTMPDYFHGELVRLLCGGDPSRLGPNYPASVERT